MASATLQIVFMGMVVLVPRYDTDHADNAATVLMPDSTRHGLSSDGCPLMPHIPLLVIQGGTCLRADGGPCETKWGNLGLREPIVPATVSGIFRLDHQQVVLRKPEGSTYFTLHRESREPEKFPEDRYHALDFRWIPSPPGLNQVRKQCLQGSECPLATRFLFDTGELETCHFTQTVNGDGATILEKSKIYSYQLGKMKHGLVTNILMGGASRAAADAFQSRTAVTVAFKKPIVISFRSFSSPLAEDNVRIWPSAGETVTLWVANIADPNAAHSHDRCDRPRMDSHFEAYYDLVGIPPTGRTPVGDDLLVPSRSVFSMKASDLGDFQQKRCPLLRWGTPLGHGPVDGDKKVCATFRGAPDPIAGPRN